MKKEWYDPVIFTFFLYFYPMKNVLKKLFCVLWWERKLVQSLRRNTLPPSAWIVNSSLDMINHTDLLYGCNTSVCSWVGTNRAENQKLLPEQAERSKESPGYVPGEGREEKCIVGGEA